MITLFPELFRLKAYAFREEHEWRLLSHLVKGGEDACYHRVMHDRIIPYRQVELVNLEQVPSPKSFWVLNTVHRRRQSRTICGRINMALYQ